MAKSTNLTDEFVKSIKPTPGKQIEYHDGKTPGLALRVSPEGTKSWSFRYRTPEGKQRRLKVGTYPAIPLAKARRKALDALAEAQDGNDPVLAKKRDKAEADLKTVRTIGDLGRDYFEAARIGRHRPGARAKRTSTLDLEYDYFNRLIVPRFGKVEIGDLQRSDFQRFLDTLSDSAPSAARQCRNVVRQMYNLAIRRELVDKNPAQFAEVPASQSRDRVLSDDEVKAIWSACERRGMADGPPMSNGMALAIQLAMVTLQRGCEVCGISFEEIDLQSKTWTLPGERTKNHRTHVVPLSDLAIELIEKARVEAASAAGDQQSSYLFPSPTGSGPISRRALTRALKRLTETIGVQDATPMIFGEPEAPT